MEIVSLGRLSSGVLLWQSRPNAWGLTVACKATFHLQPGEATLATEQEPINEEDNHWDDNVARSVHAPCDLVPFKPFVDVVLVGSAFAPKLAPVRSLIASLSVGELSKSVEVFCDRAMMPDGSIHEGSGFARMALLYERAAGGPGTWNPVGIRADARDAYGRLILPNLQKPGVRPTPTAPLEPAAFGPIASVWPARLEKLGRQAQGVSPYLFRDQPLPQGMDPAHFNAAPPDQQVASLREGDAMRLEHLHPDHAQIRTEMPSLRPAVFLRASDRAPQRLAMRIDTLWIDTDQKIFTITWRGQLALGRRDEWTQAVTAIETGPQTLTWTDVEPYAQTSRGSDGRAAPQRNPHDETVTESISPISVTEVPATPRSRTDESNRPAANIPSSQRQGIDAPPSSPLPFRPPPSRATVTLTAPGEGSTGLYEPRRIQESALPFTSAPRNPNASPRPAATDSLTARSDAALPFTPKPPPAAPESPWASGIAPAAAPAAPSSAPAESGVSSAPSDGGLAAGAAFTGAGGAIAASNAAAAAQPAWLPSTAAKPAPTGAPAPVVLPPRTASRAEPPNVIQLIWYHEPSVARIRRSSEWKPILKELERKPRDKELDDPALAQDPMEMEERREVFEVLTHALPKAYESVQQAYVDAIREDGKFVPPLVLVTGELTFPFDELETLKATVTTVSPLVTPNDENLRACVESAKEFLKTPGLSSAPAVSEGLTMRIKEAFGQGRRNVPAGYVDTQTERVLLEQRHYQKRAVLGEKHLRALLPMAGSTAPVPVYIPEAVSEKLPMYQRVRARLIAEVHQQEDQHETHSLAFRALALSRLSPPPKRS